MLVFILANLPFPVILYLNLRVTARYWQVRRLASHAPVAKPKRLLVGWWLNNVSIVFALIPPLSEQRFFVQDQRWLWSYAVSAALTITGLLLMNSALGEELRSLSRRSHHKMPRKPVDTAPTDTL